MVGGGVGPREYIISLSEMEVDVHAAALRGDVQEVQQYLTAGGEPNLLNDAGITPLHR